MCRRIPSAFAALFALATLAAAERGQSEWSEKYVNPKPLADDYVLPMPCGGTMVFRRIDVPSDGLLDDRKTVIGGVDDRFAFAENSRYAYVTGGITDPDSTARRSFYIGKYEVSRLQIEALGESCPKPTMKGRLPAAGLSWFDAVEFAHDYTNWVYKNARDRLPQEDGVPAFLRLPTESEWEYAARGGAKVSEAVFQDPAFPMPEGMHRYVWSQGTRSANGRLQLTGLLLPNPLGLHDMLGNVDEIILDPFRLNKLSRLHGHAGGFVVKGGNYLTSTADIRSAYRQELPHFDERGPKRVPTVGFRLAISVPVMTSRERFQKIKDAWNALPMSIAVSARTEQLDDPFAELALIANATSDPDLRRRLNGLERTLKSNFANRNEQQARAAKSVVRLGAFLSRKIYDDMVRVRVTRGILARLREMGSRPEGIAKAHGRFEANERVLKENFEYYVDTVIQAAQEYPGPIIKRQLSALEVEFQHRDLTALIPAARKFVGHVEEYRRAGRADREIWLEQLGTN